MLLLLCSDVMLLCSDAAFQANTEGPAVAFVRRQMEVMDAEKISPRKAFERVLVRCNLPRCLCLVRCNLPPVPLPGKMQPASVPLPG